MIFRQSLSYSNVFQKAAVVFKPVYTSHVARIHISLKSYTLIQRGIVHTAVVASCYQTHRQLQSAQSPYKKSATSKPHSHHHLFTVNPLQHSLVPTIAVYVPLANTAALIHSLFSSHSCQLMHVAVADTARHVLLPRAVT